MVFPSVLLSLSLAAVFAAFPVVAVPATDTERFSPDFRYDKHETDYRKLPRRSQLPRVPGHLEGSAWLWGEDDGLGRLNFLTPQRVYRSMKDVRTGDLVPLNLPVKLVDPPLFDRLPFNHTFVKFGDIIVLDELYEMNTQTSSQWDGFHHFAHQASGIFYNGCTLDDIPGANLTANHKCGIQEWAAHGIAGRGILLDFAGWAEATGVVAPALTATNITLAQLHAVAKHQGLDLRRSIDGGDIRIGDILLVRSGFGKAYAALTAAGRAALAAAPPSFIGVDQSAEMAAWIHDSYFAAVAGDQPAFESWPALGPLSLHEQVLSLWGIGLGELFDLERLAELCEKRKKWTFFVTSAPFNVDRGIASWANAIAIL